MGKKEKLLLEQNERLREEIVLLKAQSQKKTRKRKFDFSLGNIADLTCAVVAFGALGGAILAALGIISYSVYYGITIKTSLPEWVAILAAIIEGVISLLVCYSILTSTDRIDKYVTAWYLAEHPELSEEDIAGDAGFL